MNSIKKWLSIVNLKVVALRGFEEKLKYKNKETELRYVLFDDEKTFIEFIEQNDDYHDCDNSARTMRITKDEILWKTIFNMDFIYREITTTSF